GQPTLTILVDPGENGRPANVHGLGDLISGQSILVQLHRDQTLFVSSSSALLRHAQSIAHYRHIVYKFMYWLVPGSTEGEGRGIGRREVRYPGAGQHATAN